MSPFHQESHDLLVIPGPIEVADSVLYANAHPSMSHVGKDFISVFGDCIRMTREVLYAGNTTQPFLISGSGTLGWDQVAANLVEEGDEALVLNSGYFGDAFADCLETYRAKVTQVKAPIGRAVSLAALESALKQKKAEGKAYKVVTFTHVDTSTAVLSDAKGIAEVVRRISPETLVVGDAVCSVASEEIRFDGWDLDIILSASQKGLGTPPGLSILVASARAMQVFKNRKTPPASYYGSWKKWLPIMNAYEAGSPMYFATPPVNLFYAYRASLQIITAKNVPSEVIVPLSERFALHKSASDRVKAAGAKLGMGQVPQAAGEAANGMTALYYPEGLGAADILPRLAKRGIVAAGGLHAEIKDKYFRIGHMGITAVDTKRGDVDRIIQALNEVVAEAQAAKQPATP